MAATHERAPRGDPARSDRCSLRLAGYEDLSAWLLAREEGAALGAVRDSLRAHGEPTFDLRANEIADPRPGDHVALGDETFAIQGISALEARPPPRHAV